MRKILTPSRGGRPPAFQTSPVVVVHISPRWRYGGRASSPIPEAIREELDLHEGDHLVATVEDRRLILIPATVIPDDQAWFWTPEWQAREAEADQEIADGGGPVMSADEFIPSSPSGPASRRTT
jgi:AbrB family looped-hinge helix DNA binding protein